jgi:hypothetical protein
MEGKRKEGGECSVDSWCVDTVYVCYGFGLPLSVFPIMYSLCVVQVESFVQGQLSLYSLGRLQLPQTPFVTDSTTSSKSRRVQGSPFSE